MDLSLRLIQESQVGPVAQSYLYCLKARSYLWVQLGLCFLELPAIQLLLENLFLLLFLQRRWLQWLQIALWGQLPHCYPRGPKNQCLPSHQSVRLDRWHLWHQHLQRHLLLLWNRWIPHLHHPKYLQVQEHP